MSDKGHVGWSPDYQSPKPGVSTAHLSVPAAQGIKSPKDKEVISERARKSLERVQGGGQVSSPLDRIESDRLRDQLRDALNGRFVGGDVAWNLLNTWDALVNVAKAAEWVKGASYHKTPNEVAVFKPAHDALREALAVLNKEPA